MTRTSKWKSSLAGFVSSSAVDDEAGQLQKAHVGEQNGRSVVRC